MSFTNSSATDCSSSRSSSTAARCRRSWAAPGL
jgi:hypothetical protein